MITLEQAMLIASIATLGVCLAVFLVFLFTRKPFVKSVAHGNPHPVSVRAFTNRGYLWVALLGLALLFVTILIVARAIVSGHGPFSNMYEFSVAFSWGIILMSLIFMWRYRITVLGVAGVVLALGLLAFASTLPSRVIPLVPALQQSVLLSVHVASAIIAYGALAVGFAAAAIYLMIERRNVSWVPGPETLDNIGYRAVTVGFPFLTLTIILGAVWANVAWGSPWSWDPKETASLVTWLVFAAYLHARVLRGWRGTRSATLLAIGFLAILFTFFGNYIFAGLHSYR
jgi:cytochrome c-type biogenesis protein CcsB